MTWQWSVIGPLFSFAGSRPTGERYIDDRPRIPLGSRKKAWKAKYKGYRPLPVPRFPRIVPYNWRAEISARKAAHARALAAPQGMPLFGDGDHAARARNRRGAYLSDADFGAALAEARYHDWQEMTRLAERAKARQ